MPLESVWSDFAVAHARDCSLILATINPAILVLWAQALSRLALREIALGIQTCRSQTHQAAMKQQARKGRCLHFSDGLQCNEIISAHSIQKRGQLGLIAESDHVYRLNADLSTLKETGGKPLPKKIGVNRASTFPGMCKQHDNKLFSPIDDRPLAIDHHQVALYAYRSICREYFVKENASTTLTEMLEHWAIRRRRQHRVSIL